MIKLGTLARVTRHVFVTRRIVGCCSCLSPPICFLNASVVSPLTSFKRLFSSGVECQNLDDVVSYIKSGVRKIVVMAGAGISTPSGIPDFRTPGTGLYDNLQKYDLPYAEAIFDIGYFDHAPEAFFSLAKELYPSGAYRPNQAHYFVRLLHEKGLLLRMYTQNIDGLERLAGIPDNKLMEAHGSFHTATCRTCLKSYKGSEIRDDILAGKIPKCDRNYCKGVIKPDIVFFGEQLPISFWKFVVELPQADLLIVIGTSLEVQPFAGVAEAVLPGTPRILFNKEATGSFVDYPRKNDVIVEGDLVAGVVDFCERLGWKDDLHKLVSENEAKFNKKL